MRWTSSTYIVLSTFCRTILWDTAIRTCASNSATTEQNLKWSLVPASTDRYGTGNVRMTMRGRCPCQLQRWGLSLYLIIDLLVSQHYCMYFYNVISRCLFTLQLCVISVIKHVTWLFFFFEKDFFWMCFC